MKLFKTDVIGIGPFCIEFADGEIITTRSAERQQAIASAVLLREAANERNPIGIRYVDELFDWLDNLVDGAPDASENARQACAYVDYVRHLRTALTAAPEPPKETL